MIKFTEGASVKPKTGIRRGRLTVIYWSLNFRAPHLHGPFKDPVVNL